MTATAFKMIMTLTLNNVLLLPLAPNWRQLSPPCLVVWFVGI